MERPRHLLDTGSLSSGSISRTYCPKWVPPCPEEVLVLAFPRPVRRFHSYLVVGSRGCVRTSDGGPCLTQLHLISTFCLPVKTISGKHSHLTFMKEQTWDICHKIDGSLQVCICEMDFSFFLSLISPSNSLWRDSLRPCWWASHVSSLLLVSGIAAKLSVHVLCFGFFFFYAVHTWERMNKAIILEKE